MQLKHIFHLVASIITKFFGSIFINKELLIYGQGLRFSFIEKVCIVYACGIAQ